MYQKYGYCIPNKILLVDKYEIVTRNLVLNKLTKHNIANIIKSITRPIALK